MDDSTCGPGISEDGKQLSFVGRDCDCVPLDLAEQYGKYVRRIDLSFNRIRSLLGVEAFPYVEEMILDNNEIDDDMEFPPLPKVHTLTLNKNKITDLDSLIAKIKHNLPALTYLSVLGNPACPDQLSGLDKDDDDYRRYRLYILYQIPNLKFLDSTPVKASERTAATRQGEFLKVVRPTREEAGDAEFKGNNNFTPLPQASKLSEPENKALYGKCKYVYYGRHSEGNRFIRNNDL